MSDVDVVAFTALGWEARTVLAGLGDVRPAEGPRRWRGRLADGGSCLVIQTGIGLRRAAEAARTAPAAGAFLSFGCGGGLVPWLHTGDVVVATEVVYLGAGCRPDAWAPARAGSAGELGAHAGAIASSPTVLHTTAEKTAAAGCGALLVDMESWALAAEAERRGVLFAAVRVVLDAAAEDLPELDGAIDAATGELDAWRAARALLPRPWAWPAAMRMARQQAEAAERLAEAVAVLLRKRGGLGVGGAPAAEGS